MSVEALACLHCGERLPQGASFCPACGAAVTRCPMCRSLIPNDADFCGVCGADIRHLERTGEYDMHHSHEQKRPDVIRASTDSMLRQFLRPEVCGFLYDPRNPTMHHVLARGENTIGCGGHNDIVVHRDTISWTHAILIAKENRILLQDSASTNGTLLNGVRVVRPIRVHHGDVIRLADIDFALWLRSEYRKKEAPRR